jgi:hypothetical protein
MVEDQSGIVPQAPASEDEREAQFTILTCEQFHASATREQWAEASPFKIQERSSA